MSEFTVTYIDPDHFLLGDDSHLHEVASQSEYQIIRIDSHFQCKFSDDTILAYANLDLQPPNALLTEFEVYEDYRDFGVGEVLLNFIKQFTMENNHELIVSCELKDIE